ncbi:hypothetical protein ACODT5_28725 [Streptomyces sp. 5.8]|uniref:hypothetical protein n=1 Tax=Streptomyces sp. 5.8 TaxID=3406571 RepID=UPI003BB550D6
MSVITELPDGLVYRVGREHAASRLHIFRPETDDNWCPAKGSKIPSAAHLATHAPEVCSRCERAFLKAMSEAAPVEPEPEPEGAQGSLFDADPEPEPETEMAAAPAAEEHHDDEPEAEPEGGFEELPLASGEPGEELLAPLRALMAQVLEGGEKVTSAHVEAAQAVAMHQLALGEEQVERLLLRVSNSDNLATSRRAMVEAVVAAYGGSILSRPVYNERKSAINYLDILVWAPAGSVVALEVLLPALIMQAEFALSAASIEYRAKLRGSMPEDKEFWRLNSVYRRQYLHGFGADLGARLHEERAALLGEDAVNAEVERSRQIRDAEHPKTRKSGGSRVLKAVVGGGRYIPTSGALVSRIEPEEPAETEAA